MKRKINILALATLACGFLATSCANNEPEPQPEVKTYALTLSTDSGVESISITSGGEEVTDLAHIEEETELTATITLVDKYELSTVTLDGEAVNVTGGTYVFDMPSEDVTLAVTTERVYDSSVEVTNDSAAGSYTLTVNGTASTGEQIDSGDKVKITVSPNEHYRLSTLTVNGSAVTFADNAYEFTAIEGKNTIAIAYEQEFAFTFDLIGDTMSMPLGTLSAKVGDDVIESGDYLYEGTSVTLTLSGSYYDSYMLPGLYIYVNDTYIHGDDENVILSDDQSSISYTFTTGNNETEATVLFNSSYSMDNSGVKVTIEDTEGITIYGFEPDETYNISYSSFAFRKEEGFVLTGIQYTLADGETQTVTSTSYSYIDNGTSGYIQYYGSFREDVTLKFLGEVRDVYSIEYVGLDEVEIGNNAPFTFATSGTEGTIIQISNIYPKDKTKRIESITAEVDGEAVEDFQFSTTSYSGTSYSFTMPAGNVKITFNMAQNAKINVNSNENIESFTIKDANSTNANEITTCAPGTAFFLFMEAKDGYSISSVTDDKNNTYEVITSEQYDYTTWDTYTVTYARITMPEDGSEITLTINTSLSYTVTGTSAENYSISISGYADTYAAGATVSFSGRTTSELYNFTNVYLTDENGTKLETEVEVNNFGSYLSGSFVMPECNVIVAADVTKLETTPLTITVDNQVDGVDTASLFDSFGIYNSSSDVEISSYADNLVGDFLPGTDTNISVGLAGNYGASASYVLSDGTEEEFEDPYISIRNGVRTYSFSNTTIPEGATGIKITVYELTPFTVTLKDESGDGITLNDISFTVDGTEDASISGGVYEGSSVSAAVTKDAGSGFAYVVKFLDAETNEELELDSYGQCKVSGNIIIVVEKVQAYTFTSNNTTGYYGSARLITNDGGYYVDGDVFYGSTTGYVYITLSGFEEEVTIDYSITCGGTVVESGSTLCANGYFSYDSNNFEITGDVVVTLSLGE